MQSYLMSCCDCGLVHEIQFHVVKVVTRYFDGRWKGKYMPRKDYRVVFRARRADASTRAMRSKIKTGSYATPKSTKVIKQIFKDLRPMLERLAKK